MKLAVVVLAFVAVASAQYSQGRYNQYNSRPSNQFNPYSTPAPFRAYSTYAPSVYSSTPAPVVPVPIVARPYNQDARTAEIVKYGNEVNPDGSFNYFYETNNNIAAQVQGVPRTFGGNPPVSPVVFQGSYSYISPEGIPVGISYVADENGYQPQGDSIPTPPPVPAQIARALAYIAKYSPVQK